MAQYFFGFGSLVNLRTHQNLGARPARLDGWRRVWRGVAANEVAVLSVEPAGGHILGVVAHVPGGDWAALDERERDYERQHVTLSDPNMPSAVYVVTEHQGSPKAPVLLSYLDVVAQGYHDLYGPRGVEHFFETTEGWPAILDDRTAPRYPRAQNLSKAELSMVDHHIGALGLDWITPPA